VDRFILMRIGFLLVCAITLGYAALHFWRRRNGNDPMDSGAGFRPRIGFSRLDGMVSLSLLLENNSREYVWAEEIEIFLSGLRADQQTADSSLHEIQKIRQMVRPGDTLPISLCEVIYKAAGDPQRKYSCLLSSVLRYRIGEKQFEKTMENHKLQMMGLTASSARRERKPGPLFEVQVKSGEVPAVAAKHK
jgi:hypothetical protein